LYVVLLFPPAVDPRAPHLAIPSLAAALRQEGARVTAFDLNLRGMLWLVQRERLEAAHVTVLARVANTRDNVSITATLRDVLARAPMAIDGVDGALRTLRSAEGFLDPDRYNEARALLRCALALVSAAHPGVRCDISNAVYEVEGCDRSRLADLVRVTGDPALNLFDELWRAELLPQLANDRPDVVGVSILNGQQIIPGLMLARLLKESGHTVIIGGTVYAKFVPELLARPEFFRHFCDGVVPYEGEAAFRALVRQGSWGDAPVPNLIRLNREGRASIGPAVAEEVDALPTPDFSVLPLHDYLAPFPVLPILTGKGCYFNRCKFCDIPHINEVAGKPYRVRRAETIAADLELLHASHGARHFVITDETLSPRLLLQLADAIDARPSLRDARMRFVGYARLEPGFTPDACKRIHAMGVRKLFFGLESASQQTLDQMDKGIRVDTATQVLRHCVDAGLAVHVFSMIGFPQEDEASARLTHAFFVEHADLLGHPRHSFDIHRFGLDLRTDYFEQAGRHGVVVDRTRLAGRDFPISVDRWSNSDGLANDRVDVLLAEFEHGLHRLYAGTHLYPDQHWPGFEEYAVIYGDHYDGSNFAFRTALPSADDESRFSLRWAPHCRSGPPETEGGRAAAGTERRSAPERPRVAVARATAG
jgi:anaerobic magnesium-protoporphyrin IX monomethyl ester cyclase